MIDIYCLMGLLIRANVIRSNRTWYVGNSVSRGHLVLHAICWVCLVVLFILPCC